MSATEMPQMSHIGLGQQDVISMIKDDRVDGGGERRGDEKCGAGASNDGSAGGAV